MWIEDNYYSFKNIKRVESKKPYFNGERDYFTIKLFYNDNTISTIEIVKNNYGSTHDLYNEILDK